MYGICAGYRVIIIIIIIMHDARWCIFLRIISNVALSYRYMHSHEMHSIAYEIGIPSYKQCLLDFLFVLSTTFVLFDNAFVGFMFDFIIILIDQCHRIWNILLIDYLVKFRLEMVGIRIVLLRNKLSMRCDEQQLVIVWMCIDAQLRLYAMHRLIDMIDIGIFSDLCFFFLQLSASANMNKIHFLRLVCCSFPCIFWCANFVYMILHFFFSK